MLALSYPDAPVTGDRLIHDADFSRIFPNGWWSTSKNISFNMRGARRGHYTVEGTTDLTVKADFNGDGDFDAIEGWDASESDDFDIE